MELELELELAEVLFLPEYCLVYICKRDFDYSLEHNVEILEQEGLFRYTSPQPFLPVLVDCRLTKQDQHLSKTFPTFALL